MNAALFLLAITGHRTLPTGQLTVQLEIKWVERFPTATCDLPVIYAGGVDGLEYAGPELRQAQADSGSHPHKGDCRKSGRGT